MELHRRDEPEAVVIEVSGDLDMAGADALLVVGKAALTQSRLACLVLDLAAVDFLDSTGLGTLVELRNVATDTGGSLLLRQPSTCVRRLLELTALDAVFTVE